MKLVEKKLSRLGGACHRNQASGFTILELLVAVAVSLVLVGFLFQILNTTLTTWTRNEQRADTFRDARAALQMMARDLSQTVAPPQPATTPAPPARPGSAIPVLVIERYPNPDPPRAVGDEKNEEVYFLTSTPNSGLSSLCAVGYFCQWIPDMQTDVTKQQRAPRSYALMRWTLNSNDTFARFQTAMGNNPLRFTDLYARDSLTNRSAAAQTTQIASYIWDLQFRIDTSLTVAAGDAATQAPVDHDTPKARAYGVETSENPSGSPKLFPVSLPTYIEIRFKALSPASARRIESNPGITRATWTDPTSNLYRTTILPSMQQFVLRVPLSKSTTQ